MAHSPLFRGLVLALQRARRQPGGFVGEAWTDFGYAEAWDETQRQTNRPDGALTFFVGGNEVDAASDASPKSVGRTFVERLDRVLPNDNP